MPRQQDVSGRTTAARAEGVAMPYVNCALCGVVNFTVAYWSNVERCAGCGEPLPRPGSVITAASLRAKPADTPGPVSRTRA